MPSTTMTPRLVAVGLLLAVAGCDVFETEPDGQLTVESAYNDVPGAVSAVNGVYTPNLSNDLYDQNFVHLLDEASDDAWGWAGNSLANYYQYTPGSGGPTGAWRAAYAGITRANTLLDRLPEINARNDQERRLKGYVEGQARFLRAFYYFHLVRLYGDVPLLLSELESPAGAAVPRAPTAEVYAQIEADLQAALPLLVPVGDLNGSSGFERGRVTRGAAQALLAKAYLTVERWQEAADAAAAVMGGPYALLPVYADNFAGRNENSAESVFEVQFAPGAGGDVGSNLSRFLAPPALYGGGGSEQIFATDNRLDYLPNVPATGNGLVQAYEEGDVRFDTTFSRYGQARSIFGGPQPYELATTKYFVPPPVASGQSGANVPVFRFAEVLLIRAEALAQLGQLGEAKALADRVRARAGLDPLPDGLDQGALLQAIYKERRTELAFEFKRFYDLNRWGVLSERLAAQGVTVPAGTVTPHPITGKPQFLYPVPDQEILTNSNLTQNPGY